jgi:hypothetical protein
MTYATSISSIGGGGDVRDAVRAACALSDVVEIAVGARALENDPWHALMEIKADTHVEFVGHHTLPLVAGSAVRPGLNNQREIAALLNRYEITQYSAHPLQLSEVTEGELFEWFYRSADIFGEHGISFSLETMYTPRDSRDRTSGRWHLMDEDTVRRFVESAMGRGYNRPLLLDLAHIHIEVQHHRWRWESVHELVKSSAVSCVHVSENDGRRDRHDQLSDAHQVRRELNKIEAAFDGLIIDEGRVR